MSLQEDCRMNRWPARDTATTFYECVCVLLISLQEHLLRSVWHRSELTLLPAAVEKSMFSAFMLDYRHLIDRVVNYPACGKDHTCQSDRTPARTCQSATCMLPTSLAVRTAVFIPPREALHFFWFHWHQCYSLVNVCFSSGGNCKTLHKHSLTSDSKEKPKGAMIQNLKVALSIVLLSNRLLPSQPCSR